ncbi:tetratricopeptide repeat protein [Limnoglobus roseus]|uniref:Tetratricopeptide repeat protein n=1 Tax=Limnoglobus roseus TaxID=2598579 RepID=A0A5C1ACH6_9BACT|nr:hypothetical protein [Limnoglobus roseus]QEL15686.1 hypothetical protein PX52LOC_02621 [Limnoglobus roseus]
MVTDTAADAKTTQPRNLWQLPIFLLGLLALYGAYKYVPHRGATAGPATAGELADLKSALEQRSPDAAAIEPLVRKLAATNPTDTPTNFALGSGYVALADKAGGDGIEYWAAAEKAFERCDVTQLDNHGEAAKMIFRFALAKAATETGNPAEVLGAMTSPPAGEDRAEYPRLVAQTFLRMTPPNYAGAKEAFAKYLGGQNRSTPATAAKYKLELVKLHLRDKELDKAKTWLKDIGTTAPADVQAAAKVQLGRVAMAEQNWADAVAQFEAALLSGQLPTEERTTVRYQAALSLMQSGNDAAAAPYLKQVLAQPGEVAAAAAMKLAAIGSRDPAAKGSRKEAAEWLEKAVTQASATSEHVKTPELRAVFEEVIKASTSEGDFEAAHRAATAYAKIAEESADRKYRAEINAQWATALVKTNPADAKPKFMDAATEYATLADRALDPKERAELFRKGALQYQKAGESSKALELVTSVLNGKDVPSELLGRAWLDRADLLPPDQAAEIEEALKRAVSLPGSAATPARYKLAVTYVKRGQELLAGAAGSVQPDALKQQAAVTTKLGRDMLAQIADASTVPTDDQFTHEQAIFELGRLAMLDRKYPDAEARLRKQLTLYPQGVHADNARLWLASALLAKAQTDASVGPKARTEALVYLKELANSTDPFLQTWGEIWQANTLLQMGDTAATIPLCRELMAKHRGKLEELVLGKLLFHAYLSSRPADPGEAQKTLTRMEELFQALPRDAFRTDAEYSYDHWKAELPRLREALVKR